MFEVFEDTTLRAVWRKSSAAPAEPESPNTQFSRSWAAAAATDGMSDDLPTQIPGSAYGGSRDRFLRGLTLLCFGRFSANPRQSRHESPSSPREPSLSCFDVSTKTRPPGFFNPVTIGVMNPVVKSIVPTNGPPSAAV